MNHEELYKNIDYGPTRLTLELLLNSAVNRVDIEWCIRNKLIDYPIDLILNSPLLDTIIGIKNALNKEVASVDRDSNMNIIHIVFANGDYIKYEYYEDNILKSVIGETNNILINTRSIRSPNKICYTEYGSPGYTTIINVDGMPINTILYGSKGINSAFYYRYHQDGNLSRVKEIYNNIGKNSYRILKNYTYESNDEYLLLIKVNDKVVVDLKHETSEERMKKLDIETLKSIYVTRDTILWCKEIGLIDYPIEQLKMIQGDHMGHISSIKSGLQNSNAIMVTRDDDLNITSVGEHFTGEITSYTYDKFHRIIDVVSTDTDESYDCVVTGNTYEYSDDNGFDWTSVYDDNGNLIKDIAISNVTTYEYEGNKLLRKIIDNKIYDIDTYSNNDSLYVVTENDKVILDIPRL